PGRWSMREFQPSLESRRRGERPRMIRLLAAVALAAALPLAAYANGVVQSIKGDVKAGPGGQTARTVAVDQRLTPGTAVVTGADAQAGLRRRAVRPRRRAGGAGARDPGFGAAAGRFAGVPQHERRGRGRRGGRRTRGWGWNRRRGGRHKRRDWRDCGRGGSRGSRRG